MVFSVYQSMPEYCFSIVKCCLPSGWLILYLFIFQPVVYAQENDTPASDLFQRLESLERRLDTLRLQSAAEEIDPTTDVYHIGQLYYPERFGATRKYALSGWFRSGADHNSFISQGVVSRISANAEDSLRRLDLLLAQVAGVVAGSEVPQARILLDEARFFRNQAEISLNIGDREAAIRDMSLSESLALEAARLAGEQITTAIRDKEWDGFSELNLNWKYQPDLDTRHEWKGILRWGDEYTQARVRWEYDKRLSDTLEFLADNELRIRSYRDDLLDDDLTDALFLRLRYRPDDAWTIRLENSFYFKSEYKGSLDEGYWSTTPRLVAEYAWGAFHQLRFEYEHTRQEFRAEREKPFNYHQHRLRQGYEFFHPHGRMNLTAFQEWRDYNKPDREDDYRQQGFEGRLSRRVMEWISLGAEAGYEARDYDQPGSSNTDYAEWWAGPVMEIEWARPLMQTLRYRWRGRINRDEDRNDALVKRRGDFDSHQVNLETWWRATSQLSITLNLEGEWRWYRHGQTGSYEIYLSDFRPLSNYARSTLSTHVNYRLTDSLRLTGSLYLSEESHKRYSNFDLDETTANLEVRYEF